VLSSVVIQLYAGESMPSVQYARPYARASCAVGLEFKSRADQTLHRLQTVAMLQHLRK